VFAIPVKFATAQASFLFQKAAAGEGSVASVYGTARQTDVNCHAMATDSISPSPIRRFSSRRQPLDRPFLRQRLRGARAYDRIAGYFCSSLLEVASEELESVTGLIRMVCNSDLHPADIFTARAAHLGNYAG
jgi:hypothetical protein